MTLREKVKVLLFVAGFLLSILLAASLLIYIHPSLFWFSNGLFIGVAGTAVYWAERVMPKWEAEITQEIEARYQTKEIEDERRRSRVEPNHPPRNA